GQTVAVVRTDDEPVRPLARRRPTGIVTDGVHPAHVHVQVDPDGRQEHHEQQDQREQDLAGTEPATAAPRRPVEPLRRLRPCLCLPRRTCVHRLGGLLCTPSRGGWPLTRRSASSPASSPSTLWPRTHPGRLYVLHGVTPLQHT